MLTTVYYFLQVVLCSGLMMGYYWLVLRNRRFHQYNRFYVLVIALLSWVIPLIKIRWSHSATGTVPEMMQLLSVVADNNSRIDESLTLGGLYWNWDMVAGFIYFFIAGILLAGMLRSFLRLYHLFKKHSCKSVEDVYLVFTQAKGTPFSFFRYIFWNDEIDIRSESGRQILQHELAHVREKHTIDKLVIQVMLVAGWFNPFFWLIRKEMGMIHEFIADRKSVQNGDAVSFAQMLLTAAFPQQQFSLTNPFFFSPIKRRILMLTNNKSPRFSYLRRLVVLPLLAMVIVLFAFRNAEQRANKSLSVASVVENMVNEVSGPVSTPVTGSFGLAVLDRPYTVVIDPGHGGADRGVTTASGTTESAITLQIGKMIRELNTNNNINIKLLRDNDIFQSVKEKAELANELHPDLFVSLHCNEAIPVRHADGSSTAGLTGIEFFIASKEKSADYTSSQLLATHLNAAMGGLNEKMLGVKSRQKGIWVLQALKSPAVLIETGFLTATGEQKLAEPAYQKAMARAILQGINSYLSQPGLRSSQTVMRDTIIGQKLADTAISLGNKFSFQKALIVVDGKKAASNILETMDKDLIESVTILKDKSAHAMYGDEGINGVVLITTKSYAAKSAVPAGTVTVRGHLTDSSTHQKLTGLDVNAPKPLIMINGVKSSRMDNINPSDIKSVNVLKDQKAIEKYGTEGQNGVVEIETKPAASVMAVTPRIIQGYQIFDQVEVPAEFPGGLAAWSRYLERNLNRDVIKKNGGPNGKYTVIVSFIVDQSGNVSDVKALTDPGYGAKEEAIRVIVKGPKWKPAVQNGVEVIYRHKQSITFVVNN